MQQKTDRQQRSARYARAKLRVSKNPAFQSSCASCARRPSDLEEALDRVGDSASALRKDPCIRGICAATDLNLPTTASYAEMVAMLRMAVTGAPKEVNEFRCFRCNIPVHEHIIPSLLDEDTRIPAPAAVLIDGANSACVLDRVPRGDPTEVRILVGGRVSKVDSSRLQPASCLHFKSALAVPDNGTHPECTRCWEQFQIVDGNKLEMCVADIRRSMVVHSTESSSALENCAANGLKLEKVRKRASQKQWKNGSCSPRSAGAKKCCGLGEEGHPSVPFTDPTTALTR